MENTDLKVVIHLKGGRALVGVQGDGTDPVMEVITILHNEAPLIEAFAAAADLLEQARERWATSPRNPAYQGPPAPPAPRPQATAVARPTGRPAAPQGAMNPMF